MSHGHMKRWDRLNGRQLTTLQRIGDGNDPVSEKNPELANTVYALRGRGLVATPRRYGIWTAEITDAGRFYLEHGYHPDKPQAKPAAPPPPPPAPRLPGDKDLAAVDLIEQLRRERGTVRIPEPDDEARKRYRSAISLAKRRGLVPSGHHLLHTGRDMGDLIIRLESDAERDETEWNRIRLAARDVITDPARVAEQVDGDQHSIDVPQALLPRAHRLMETLSAKIQQHGHKLGVSRSHRPPGLFIHARGCQFPVRITRAEDSNAKHLQIEVQVSANGETVSWADDHRMQMEDKLTVMAEEFEPLAVAAEEKRIADERAWAAQLEQWRREDQEREQEWKTAMARARRRAREEHRQQAFSDALDAWHAATRIRAFCSALEQASAVSPGKHHNAICRWVAWARRRADRIDPATTLSVLTGASFDFEPGPDDLRPFLDGWSPEEPERDWRYEPERTAPAERYPDSPTLKSAFRMPGRRQ